MTLQALKNWMDERNITQTKLGEMLGGKKQATISSILNGKTALDPYDARIIIANGGPGWDELYPPKSSECEAG